MDSVQQVEVINPHIELRQSNDRSELFQPMVTSPYKLTLSEKSAITLHPNPDPYQSLLHVPTKPTAMYVPLHDIHTRGASIEYADVLGALKGLKEIRSIKCKNSDVMMQVRQIEVFDHTSLNLKVTLWEPDIINRSNFWTPKSTVLFMTDLKISWSQFDNAFVGNTSGRTVVTVDPATREGKELYEFAQSTTVETYDIVEQLVAAMPSSTAVDEILNIRQLYERVNTCCENIQSANTSFIAVIFGTVTELDLDGLSDTLSVKCGHCKMRLKGFKCENAECPVVFDNVSVEPEITFDIKVSITDHSGTLANCRLRGNVAEQALECSAKDFSALTDDEKGHLKWKYLLEQCKIRLAIVFVVGENPVFSILEIEHADPHEMATKVPVY
ncbi:meiosis-specific with OB domain-containing protein isoform X2 [Anthonomus grandis grandis]|uniref:meiosis-specific with OB domain-containing protein isoform X2 n=1 Tax=Anthonomus grandis grandis TaxID=2921223 RepID=UPI0021665243|nr:meiosis-specific with OB domain-containing protein isoform X2 [Anthonomus grandis grandis]